MYDPVIQRDRNDEKKKPEKRERLNISKSREEPADVDEKRGKLSVPRFQQPFLHTSRRISANGRSCIRIQSYDKTQFPIQSFDIVKWVNLLDPPRDLRGLGESASRGETWRSSIRVRSFVTVIEAI